MIKTFEQFVSEVYGKPVNESFHKNRLKLKDIFEQHGQPKEEQSERGSDGKLLQEIENYEIVDIIDAVKAEEYVGGDYEDENKPLSNGIKTTTFMVELEDGCGIVVRCSIVDYCEKKLGITLQEIKKEFENVLDELVYKITYDGLEIKDFKEDDFESKTSFSLDNKNCLITMNFNGHWGGEWREYGEIFDSLTIDVDEYEIEIDNYDIYSIKNSDLGITYETDKELFTYYENNISVGVYDEHERNGVKHSDFI
jgi:hypothetical protein